MQNTSQIIQKLIDEAVTTITRVADVPIALTDLERKLTDAFDWHRIDRAAEFGLAQAPTGMKWGPRVIAMVAGAPHVVYWDPDNLRPHGDPVPYWRTLGMSVDWSRRNQPTHFLCPYRPSDY